AMTEFISYLIAAGVASFLTARHYQQHYNNFASAFKEPLTKFTLTEEDGSKRLFVIEEVESFEKWMEERTKWPQKYLSMLKLCARSRTDFTLTDDDGTERHFEIREVFNHGETNGRADRDDCRSLGGARDAVNGQPDSCRAS